jgi:hypothetical protein
MQICFAAGSVVETLVLNSSQVLNHGSDIKTDGCANAAAYGQNLGSNRGKEEVDGDEVVDEVESILHLNMKICGRERFKCCVSPQIASHVLSEQDHLTTSLLEDRTEESGSDGWNQDSRIRLCQQLRERLNGCTVEMEKQIKRTTLE